MWFDGDQRLKAKNRISYRMDWQPISTAPFDRELQLAVIDAHGTHMLIFPCRRVLHGWVNAKTGAPVVVSPTHWREWNDDFGALHPPRAFERPLKR
jgi:hypothetical protein